MDISPVKELFHLRIVDIIDILLFAILLYQVYILVRGTAAVRIFLGIIAVYLIWKVVKALHMILLSEILGMFISVGVIALIVVFQPEIRQFLLVIGNTRIIRSGRKRFLFWKFRIENPLELHLDKIVKACQKMAELHTGALIVITRENALDPFVESGQVVDGKISEFLLETIFFKNSPLHDGAVIIREDKIRAARCILPVSSSTLIPALYGLRHRAAVGITERSDAIAIVVSEERGNICCSYEGKLMENITPSELNAFLEKALEE
ncbi:MAG TPA: diadenylate cyclase CdaA [Bacteroidales bacterium]|nr:diadenylate cyclase CdaA [Bacteroidales bacterium]